MKYIIGIIVIALVAVGGYYAWGMLSEPITPPSPPPQPIVETKSTYATSTFSIQYPSNYQVNDSYAYTEFEGKPIAGVKFSIPESLAAGTNLSAFDTGISVEMLPRAQNCTGDIYVLPNVKALDLTVGSTTYSVATTTGAAAGNRYEEAVYAVKGSEPCTAVRYFIHYSAIENFAPEGEGSVRAFDVAALTRAFDEIRNSLKLAQ